MTVRTKYSIFKISTSIGTILCFFAIFFHTNAVLSHVEKCEPNSVVYTEQPTDYDANNSIEIEKIKKRVQEFLSLDSANPMTQNPHIYYNIINEILQYDALADIAEQVVKKGIAVNTEENLSKSYPDMSESEIMHQQNLEYGRLYSQYAWILWKKNQLGNAFDIVHKTMNYSSLKTPDDYLRLGIIEYNNGKKQQGWQHITKALLEDTIIEVQDPGYRKAISDIIKNKFGAKQDLAAFLSEYRTQNAQIIPDINLSTSKSIGINLRKQKGKVVFVNFFSPTCSSCQQEIPRIKNLYDKYSTNDNVIFIFILNRPNMMQEGISLFEKSGIDKPVITILTEGSIWEFISVEPSVWLADKTGKLVFKHSGYKDNDESIYERELSKLIMD